jgi:hypothetical protein
MVSILMHSIETPVWVRGVVDEITQGTNQKKIILSVRKIQTVVKNPPKKIQLIYRSKKEKEIHPGDYIVVINAEEIQELSTGA